MLTARASAERLMLERVERAERLLAAQRRLVLQLEARKVDARGVNLVEARALLKVMESVAEQFHVAWRLFRTYAQPSEPAWHEPARAAIAEGSSPTAGSWPATPGASAAHVSCPHCGLRLGLGGENGAFGYDMREWARRCRYQKLQTPALCQLLQERLATVH